MFVFYSGLGYYEYYFEEADHYFKKNPRKISSIFSLPKDNEKELKYRGETTTDYLYVIEDVEHTDIDKVPAFNPPPSDGYRITFNLCEEWDRNKLIGIDGIPIKRPYTFTSKDVVELPAVSRIKEELTTKERGTMLKLILGMAMDAYKYDPEKGRNSATGGKNGGIKAALQCLELGVDEKTISKYLIEAATLYPDAKPRKS